MPQRSPTTTTNASSAPMPAPHAHTTRWCSHASVRPRPMSGVPGVAIANANTALRYKLAAVIAVIRTIVTTRSGPVMIVNDLPWSACAFKSVIATQIHIAGSTCMTVSRQFETSSFSPSKSIANAPTTSANGANHRRVRLRLRRASSTVASSESRITRTMRASCAVPVARHDRPSSFESPGDAFVTRSTVRIQHAGSSAAWSQITLRLSRSLDAHQPGIAGM